MNRWVMGRSWGRTYLNFRRITQHHVVLQEDQGTESLEIIFPTILQNLFGVFCERQDEFVGPTTLIISPKFLVCRALELAVGAD